MKQEVTKGIVLARTNFGEADRIVTVLTPSHGKLRLMARGVRKTKSKLAGGIELLSVSDLTFIRGRGDISTLVSARLQTHYGAIVQDIDRTMLAYELIKQLNKATEDEPESAYFALLEQSFAALDDHSIDKILIEIWFAAQLLRLSGHAPNLRTDTAGNKLQADQSYNFSFDDMSFAVAPAGKFGADHIKLLRLLFEGHTPATLAHVKGSVSLLQQLTPVLQTMRQLHLRT